MISHALSKKTFYVIGAILLLSQVSIAYAEQQPSGTGITSQQSSNAYASNCANGGGTLPNGQPAGCNLGYTPLEPIPGVTSGYPITDPRYIGTLANNLFKLLFTVGALFSVVMLTLSGIRYMLSEIVTEKSKALNRIQACIYALLLLAGSWLILHTINPQLLNFTLNPGTAVISGVQQQTATPTTPTGCTGCTISSAGTVPTIISQDGNASIIAAQNQPNLVQNPDGMKAASDELKMIDAACAGNYSGVIGPGEGGSTGCLADQPIHYKGSTAYTNCANIPTPSGQTQSCFYNK